MQSRQDPAKSRTTPKACTSGLYLHLQNSLQEDTNECSQLKQRIALDVLYCMKNCCCDYYNCDISAMTWTTPFTKTTVVTHKLVLVLPLSFFMCHCVFLAGWFGSELTPMIHKVIYCWCSGSDVHADCILVHVGAAGQDWANFSVS